MDDAWEDLTPSAAYTLCVRTRAGVIRRARGGHWTPCAAPSLTRRRDDRRKLNWWEDPSTIDDWIWIDGDILHVLDIIDPPGLPPRGRRRRRRRRRRPRRRTRGPCRRRPRRYLHRIHVLPVHTCAGDEDNRYRWSSSSDAYDACIDAGCADLASLSMLNSDHYAYAPGRRGHRCPPRPTSSAGPRGTATHRAARQHRTLLSAETAAWYMQTRSRGAAPAASRATTCGRARAPLPPIGCPRHAVCPPPPPGAPSAAAGRCRRRCTRRLPARRLAPRRLLRSRRLAPAWHASTRQAAAWHPPGTPPPIASRRLALRTHAAACRAAAAVGTGGQSTAHAAAAAHAAAVAAAQRAATRAGGRAAARAAAAPAARWPAADVAAAAAAARSAAAARRAAAAAQPAAAAGLAARAALLAGPGAQAAAARDALAAAAAAAALPAGQGAQAAAALPARQGAQPAAAARASGRPDAAAKVASARRTTPCSRCSPSSALWPSRCSAASWAAAPSSAWSCRPTAPRSRRATTSSPTRAGARHAEQQRARARDALDQGPALLNPNQLKVTLGLQGGSRRRTPTVEGQRLLS